MAKAKPTKEQQPQPPQPKPSNQPTPVAQSVRYFKEVRAEMSKVIWPSREQAINLTVLVLGVMVAMGVFLGFLDFAFGELIRLLIGAA